MKDKNIEFILNTILFAKFLLYQDKFTSYELEHDEDIRNIKELFVFKNKEWINDINTIRTMDVNQDIHISSTYIMSLDGVGYYAYSSKSEDELYKYLINDLCDHYIAVSEMTLEDIECALESIEEDLFDIYRSNLALANKMILDVSNRFKIKPDLKRPLLTIV
ncbi:hypothetical protein CPS91_004365 [Salmonella enterica subsp. enterica]|nr:hypothetical protein [Salmonella enterica subsp. enterica]EDN7307237.1 hypothetical protein [Salmonella enterica subsp. enterica]EDQ3366031.1 hypothetical protein [Salmonella enterica subsp. enterica]EDR5096806.1 hypothetical protein [Salmonella enterica subsp. enterica]EDS2029714.1 hypothetical protein [Salmonella enterica subsp. enterica]